MAKKIQEVVPDASISGVPGRQASFEIHINDELVYSKLQTMAFPDFDDVAQLVQNVSTKGELITSIKQQPIDCLIS